MSKRAPRKPKNQTVAEERALAEGTLADAERRAPEPLTTIPDGAVEAIVGGPVTLADPAPFGAHAPTINAVEKALKFVAQDETALRPGIDPPSIETLKLQAKIGEIESQRKDSE